MSGEKKGATVVPWETFKGRMLAKAQSGSSTPTPHDANVSVFYEDADAGMFFPLGIEDTFFGDLFVPEVDILFPRQAASRTHLRVVEATPPKDTLP